LHKKYHFGRILAAVFFSKRDITKMVEYGIMIAKNFSLSSIGGSSELMMYFLFGGIIVVVIGYWIKKWTGVIIGLLGVLFAYLYFSGFFSRIMG
jgi:hypothetical protein